MSNDARGTRWNAAVITALALLILFVVPAAEGQAKLKADYRFEGNLKSSVLGAPQLQNIGVGNSFKTNRVPGSGKTKVLRFLEGNGVVADTSKLAPSGSYSVVVEFRMDEINPLSTGQFFRVLNSNPLGAGVDSGLYVNSKVLDFITPDSHLGESFFRPDVYKEVAFTRAGATKQVRAYANGSPDLTYTDTNDDAVIQQDTLQFFKDNSDVNGEEESAGAVARIRIYNNTLSKDQVKRIYKKGH